MAKILRFDEAEQETSTQRLTVLFYANLSCNPQAKMMKMLKNMKRLNCFSPVEKDLAAGKL